MNIHLKCVCGAELIVDDSESGSIGRAFDRMRVDSWTDDHRMCREEDKVDEQPNYPEWKNIMDTCAKGAAETKARVFDEVRAIFTQREEILTAFIAKYGCEPDECVQTVRTVAPGHQEWSVQRKVRIETGYTPPGGYKIPIDPMDTRTKAES